VATAVIWYSDKADDPSEMKLVIDTAKEWCRMHNISFNRIVNQSLRAAIGMPALDIDGLRAQQKKVRQDRLADARSKRTAASTPKAAPVAIVAPPVPKAKGRSKKAAL